MAVEREYEYFFAVMMGMAMLMAAGTIVAAAEDTDRSKTQRPLIQATSEAPFSVNLARTTETKSRPFDSVAGGSTDMTINEQADLRGAILFIFILLVLTFILVMCINRALFDFILT